MTMTMTTKHPHPMTSDLLSSQNESWDDVSLHQVGAVFPSRAESLHNRAEPAKAASLDDYLHEYPSSIPDFTLSIPSNSLPANMPSDNEQKNEEEGSCCDQSIVSDLTQMTYRAELMKQVSSEQAMLLH